MSNFKSIQLNKIAYFNPSEKLTAGTTAKKIPMAQLKEFQRKISGYELAEYKAGPKFRNHDTLVAKITPCLENGKTAYVDILDNDEIAFGSSEFIVLRAKGKNSPEFLYYLSISPAFRARAISCMEGTSGRKRVNEGILKFYELPIPTEKKQEKIAAILSALDKKIELNNRINTELEAMAKTLYDYWFVQFDFPDANGNPYKTSGGKMVYNETLKREIPEGWKVVSLMDIASFKNGIACQRYFPKDDEIGVYKVIKIREFSSGLDENSDVVTSDIPEGLIIQDGDVLFSWSATLDVKLWSGGVGALNQHIFKVDSLKYPKSFYYFKVLGYLEHFKMIAELRKTTMGHITRAHLEGSYIPLPPKKLIQQLDLSLKPLLDQIIAKDKESQKLADLRDWLLPMLMNGQITVT